MVVVYGLTQSLLYVLVKPCQKNMLGVRRGKPLVREREEIDGILRVSVQLLQLFLEEFDGVLSFDVVALVFHQHLVSLNLDQTCDTLLVPLFNVEIMRMERRHQVYGFHVIRPSH